MSIQYSVAVRNGRLNAIETVAGVSAKLYLRSGAKPATCADADTGLELAVLSLPVDWMQDAAGGVKQKSVAVWTGVGAIAGVIAHFRIKDSPGTTCHIQGSVTLTGVGGELELDNTNVTVGQSIVIDNFSLTDGNP